MITKNDLLKSRFHLNMSRIGSLVNLLTSHDTPEQVKLFGDSEGVRADILRSIVVFLHATFEVVLRSHIPKQNSKFSFYRALISKRHSRKSMLIQNPLEHFSLP